MDHLSTITGNVGLGVQHVAFHESFHNSVSDLSYLNHNTFLFFRP